MQLQLALTVVGIIVLFLAIQRLRKHQGHKLANQNSEHDLSRFLTAQEKVLDDVCRELKAGKKQTHWMWFVFPQISGLGSSETSKKYAIQDLSEARAYLAHPVLGERLRDWIGLTVAHADVSPENIFGDIDAKKFQSCLTLFLQASIQPEGRAVFQLALDVFFSGEEDGDTLRIISNQGPT